ncbi:MAG TPA: formate-dependent phosphoribosylglycinamide formyltransferase [Methylococcus sp.]|nr:formate-dependent phosphoribosylglycinamide formyltransferase [Methylococcus sp.]
MRIGTSNKSSATRVLLLGSGELGKEVVISLQRYGVEVIAVDRYAGAPAQQVAHRSHVVDMTDPRAVRKVVELEKPQIVIPEIEAIATEVLLDIERAGIAEVIPCARAVHLTMNREGIRRLAAETLGLPTSPYAFAGSEEELRKALDLVGLPCFVKPVMSSSGKGQSMLSRPEDVAAAWRHAQEAGRVKAGRVIVEGKVDFDFEITLLTVRGRNPELGVETFFCAPVGHRQEAGDYVESWQPQPMSPVALQRAQEIAKTVVEELGGRGLFGVELFVRGDRVWFSEVSPRPHDTGMVTLVTQAQNEFELHVRAILGFPVDTALRRAGASSVIYGGIESEDLAYEGLDLALAIPESEVRLFGKPVSHPRRRMGVALAAAETVDLARERARKVSSLVRPVAADS